MGDFISNDVTARVSFSSDQLDAIRCQKPVLGLTHNYYRYPARFSPQLARTLIQTMTKPGDLVLDPFCGGATTLVEAAALGRRSIGIDINPLAVFLARVKTRPIDSQSRSQIQSWAHSTSSLTLRNHIEPEESKWGMLGYHKYLDSRSTWPTRKCLEVFLSKLHELEHEHSQEFARCAILRTGQWALDGRKKPPTAGEIRGFFRDLVEKMLNKMTEYANIIQGLEPSLHIPFCLQRPAVEIHLDAIVKEQGAPKLVLTSPPYPGVHILYHRWQIAGRRETSAPFWIANELDGKNESYYTFGSRHQHNKGVYFDCLRKSFESIRAVSNSQTRFVQIVGFSDPRKQLRNYLQTLEDIDYEELIPYQEGINKRCRIWRKVPRRKWYAEQRDNLSSGSEVLLFHQLTGQG